MNKLQFKQFSYSLAQKLATEFEFEEHKERQFVNHCDVCDRIFFLDEKVSKNSGELTIHVGIVIPAFDELLSLLPGLEKPGYPTFGGPIFRFVDLSQERLHDYVVKVLSLNSFNKTLEELKIVWNKSCTPFFNSYSKVSSWYVIFENFYASNKIGPLKLPTLGRMCIVWAHVINGYNEGVRVLKILKSRGPKGTPVQDFEEAVKLNEMLAQQPSLMAKLKKIIT